jgi:hypothetical protein
MEPVRPSQLPLEYAQPQRRPSRFKYSAALAFSCVGLLLGGSWVFWAVAIMRGASRFQNRQQYREEFSDGIRLLACALILTVPAIWYGRVALRGLRGDCTEAGG